MGSIDCSEDVLDLEAFVGFTGLESDIASALIFTLLVVILWISSLLRVFEED